jgi:hypothetical protein
VPSYCDRILFTSLPGAETKIHQTAYDSAAEATSSDHQPVWAGFELSPVWAHDAAALRYVSMGALDIQLLEEDQEAAPPEKEGMMLDPSGSLKLRRKTSIDEVGFGAVAGT